MRTRASAQHNAQHMATHGTRRRPVPNGDLVGQPAAIMRALLEACPGEGWYEMPLVVDNLTRRTQRDRQRTPSSGTGDPNRRKVREELRQLDRDLGVIERVDGKVRITQRGWLIDFIAEVSK